MSGIAPKFFKQPIQYLRWAAHEKPAIFYSMAIGCLGPPIALFAPPIRHYFGDTDPERIPMTYPVPTGPRKILDGYEDE